MKYIIFTDLDGTLIDHATYSYEAALSAISGLKEKQIPLIFCTSKTRAEIEVYLAELNVADPFISENGGAVFIPHGYFDVDYVISRKTDTYDIIELGVGYGTLRDFLINIRNSEGFDIIGFGDMDENEVSEDTGLDIESARLAKMREYDEAFKFSGGETQVSRLIECIKSYGFNYTRGGRYWHIIGDNDKGKAVRILSDIFRRQFGKIKTIALGDSLNDLPMLQAVDMAFLVQKPGGVHDPGIQDDNIRKVEGVGPSGWNAAILSVLS